MEILHQIFPSKGNIFRVTGHLCGEFTGPFFTVIGNRGVSFDLHLNKRLSKQSWRWWFETQSRPLWRHCNDVDELLITRSWHRLPCHKLSGGTWLWWWFDTTYCLLLCGDYKKLLVYHQTSNISHTKSQHLNVSRLVLQLSLPNLLKPGVTSRMKMYLEQRHMWVIKNFIAH